MEENSLSVFMTTKFNADTEAFRKFVDERGDALVAIREDAKSKGCLSHRHALGDGYVLVIDEWESADAFHDFFQGNEAIQEVMQSMRTEGEPVHTSGEILNSPDTF